MTNISLEPEGAWIEWRGGECPVVVGCSYGRRYRDGIEQTAKPDMGYAYEATFDDDIWSHNGGPNDIIAYRVVKP